MNQRIKTYLTAVRTKRNSGVAGEHAYRPPFETLLTALGGAGLTVINDPRRSSYGAPDFILLKDGLPLGYVEAKDIGTPLQQVAGSEQLRRYRGSLHNLMLTNYLDFQWYVDGDLRQEVTLARVQDGRVLATPHGPAQLESLLAQFFSQDVTPVSTAEELAKRMAHLARLMDEGITKAFEQDGENGPFHAQLRAFQKALIPDLSPAAFADMYAQTLTYGLFAARVQQMDGGGSFNRDTVPRYLPSTNPFLRSFFHQLSGPNMPEAISWLVDDLAHLLERAELGQILAQFGKRTRQEDPIIHFYETFLREYDPRLRQRRGVYYTPEPVVSYIVRSLDHILQSHFGREAGLADQNTMILDPATGTGTFLYFVIQHIYERVRQRDGTGAWESYVQQHLLPRLFGFELLMAPYAVAHLKLGLLLRELDYQFRSQERLRVYLTNALSDPLEGRDALGFLRFLSDEGAQAVDVKRNKPIEVVLGNPPYSVSSSNNSDYINRLMERYKQAVRTEQNIQPLNDDYIKFIRFAHDRIERTGHGVVGMITNHAYITGLIHRGMREELMKTFSHIYVLDLHGNAVTEGTTPEGLKDENVFDIRQGVAIIFLVKDPSHTGEPLVHHKDLWGERKTKYKYLLENDLQVTQWQLLNPVPPFYFFTPKDFALEDEYMPGWDVSSMFLKYTTGFVTHRDKFAIAFSLDELKEGIQEFLKPDYSDEEIGERFNLSDTRDWKLTIARRNLQEDPNHDSYYSDCAYRPFDTRNVYYSGHVVEFPRHAIMDNFSSPNLGLISSRIIKGEIPNHFHVTISPTEKIYLSPKTSNNAFVFPLYLYSTPENMPGTLFSQMEATREPNLSQEFIRSAGERLGLRFHVPAGFTIQPPTPAGEPTFTPEDIFYYAYALFHSPTYRSRYAEFLKIDFPRLPLTSDVALFRRLAALGHELVQLHLLTSPALHQGGPAFPISGSNEVAPGYPKYSEPQQQGQEMVPGRVHINNRQYFQGIEPAVWEFPVGGYRPAEKWLKDRRGRVLAYNDITHYRQIILALRQTMHLMAEVDGAIVEWPVG